MRIISKCHDYYDKAMGLGFDPNVTYIRKTEELEKRTIYHRDVMSGEYYNDGKSIIYKVGLLGFCGKFYPYYEFKRLLNANVYAEQFETTYVWTKDQYTEYLTKHPQDPNRYSRWWHGNMLPQKERSYGSNYLNHFNAMRSQDDLIFQELGSPSILFISDSRRSAHFSVILNPKLLDIQFQKIMDPYKTYQEISMYVGGVLPRSGHEMVEISDQDKRDKHGFDDRSFKTISPGKKAKRRVK